MPYLKSAMSEFYPDIELTELSALQRLQYLEYLSEEESVLQIGDGDVGVAKVGAMNIRISARLVALSLMKTKRPDVDSMDDVAYTAAVAQVQRGILEEWSWEGIAANALLVRRLSGMIPPETSNDKPESVTGEEATAEKR